MRIDPSMPANNPMLYALNAQSSNPTPTIDEIEDLTIVPTMPTECVTCATRVYQDDSTDGGVSMQSLTNLTPYEAPAQVRNHEMEHQHRDRIAFEEQGMDVVLQFIEMHTSVCPECNRVYVSGGMSTTQAVGREGGEEHDHPLSMEEALLGMLGGGQ
ncbi:MAG: hypothetical protein FWC16_06480 [Defluviitaleaceae bacterium]|nr:hypothetical protein [Defluviitaleaceae bacterium]MCL2274556.1 hypothetical protein [Defluviitaleaceae bacterium]